MTTDSYDGIVYDLDGTLVDLDVDWNAVRRSVAATYEDAGVDPSGRGLWALLNAADEHGIETAVEAAIAEHERSGARSSKRLPLGDRLVGREDSVAVCSLNCEDACRIALETHGLADAVDGVVGRDTVATHKPDPEPLLAAVDHLGVAPGRALFVGDSQRDEETARRAGVEYRYVSELL